MSSAAAPGVAVPQADGVFCYECNATFDGQQYPPQLDSDGCRLCPSCGSDFVEIVAPAAPRQPAAVASTGVSTGDIQSQIGPPMDFTGTARLPSGGTARLSVRVIQAPMTMDALMASNLPDILSQAGAQGAAVLGVQVNSDGTMSTPVPMNFGDFASSAGLEQLLDQLAQQHQPANDPAAAAVVAALPKRLVPPADGEGSTGRPDAQGAAGSGEDEPFATCRPGEPCSVCHCAFEAGETVTQLDCRHCFHTGCILPWLRAHNTCPVCRAPLPRELPGVPGDAERPQQQADELLDAVASRMQQAALASARADLDSTRAPPDSSYDLERETLQEHAAPDAEADNEQLTEEAEEVAPEESSNANPLGWLGRAASFVLRRAWRQG